MLILVRQQSQQHADNFLIISFEKLWSISSGSNTNTTKTTRQQTDSGVTELTTQTTTHYGRGSSSDKFLVENFRLSRKTVICPIVEV